MAKLFIVRIISHKDGVVTWESNPMTEKKADMCEAGTNRNLNHNDYYTLIMEARNAKP